MPPAIRIPGGSSNLAAELLADSPVEGDPPAFDRRTPAVWPQPTQQASSREVCGTRPDRLAQDHGRPPFHEEVVSGCAGSG
eukprot:CAMPEP_0170569364 /NCGR_PEP_ID=MMETSP0224-20130122/502_1 /TAXON_ID=285029 /ORGANISM="Togula jolla, Strain CCCM 725" /LENGTH=80 /DNA_ID=CAMNT_0010891499 /DNA_START=411 /DNA_END=653 /DNA_ORIENTATION=-